MVKWLIRLILLVLVYFTALHAYESSIQVIDNSSYPGSDGQLRGIWCRPFDYDRCMKMDEELSKGYPALAGRAERLEGIASEYQTRTFMWGGASLLLCVGILLSFRRKSPA
jgi:hypothetical protein